MKRKVAYSQESKAQYDRNNNPSIYPSPLPNPSPTESLNLMSSTAPTHPLMPRYVTLRATVMQPYDLAYPPLINQSSHLSLLYTYTYTLYAILYASSHRTPTPFTQFLHEAEQRAVELTPPSPIRWPAIAPGVGELLLRLTHWLTSELQPGLRDEKKKAQPYGLLISLAPAGAIFGPGSVAGATGVLALGCM